jgi:predicted phage terminase large subunit-like protein
MASGCVTSPRISRSPCGEGTRADWGILDDPVDLDNALSPADRDRAWWWFTSTFTARLNKGARVTVIGSSWHPEDLYSKIRDGGEYEGYKYPCYGDYEWGDLLSPELWDRAALESKKREIGSTMFELRYMMNHMAMMGGFFDEKWITYIDEVPEGIDPAQGWDFAITREEIANAKRSDPDFTACATVAFDPYDGCLCLLDVFRKRVTQDHHSHIKQQWRKWGAKQVGLETNTFQKLIKYRMQEEAPEVPTVGVDHYEKKVTRLLALQPYFERGLKVYKGMAQDDLMAFLGEFRTFPHGDHDDVLDAMEIAVGMLKKGRAVLLEGFDDW